MADIRLLDHKRSGAEIHFGAKSFPGLGAAYGADLSMQLAQEGRIYVASDADQNDAVTGQTSFANTTPSFLLDVPDGTVAIPLYMNLVQSGTVAGAAITVSMEIDDATRYSSSGTAETILSSRTDDPRAENCVFYSTPTASSGYGQAIKHWLVGQDVSPAEGAVQNIEWTPSYPILLVGTATWAVYTYAGTTGPTWHWSFAWAEIDESGQLA
jgi:hypothetical protein